MHKILICIILIILLFISGCQSTSNSENIILPAWVLSPPQDDESTFYGIGSSYNFEQAKTVALQDISAKLGISLVGETLINEQMAGSRYVRYFDSNIKTTQGETLLSRYQVVKTFTDKNHVYLLIKVNKENVLNDHKHQLKQLNAKAIEQRDKKAQVSSLKWNVNTQQLLQEDTAKAMRYSIIINMLDSDLIVDDLMQSWASLNKELNTLKLCISLKSLDNLSKQYFPVIESHLVKQNIKLKDGCNNQLLVSSAAEKNKLFDYYTFKNTLHFKLNTKEEGVLVSQSVIVNGKSMTSPETSKKISVMNLQKKLDGTSIWKIIKI